MVDGDQMRLAQSKAMTNKKPPIAHGSKPHFLISAMFSSDLIFKAS
jgi:hypothetical protein